MKVLTILVLLPLLSLTADHTFYVTSDGTTGNPSGTYGAAEGNPYLDINEVFTVDNLAD